MLADGDVEEVKLAIGYVAKARGMTQVAKDAGIGRVALYKAWHPSTQMRANTMLNVMRGRTGASRHRGVRPLAVAHDRVGGM